MEKKLLALLLKKEFYDAHKHQLIDRMFPDTAGAVYQTIVMAHAEYQRDITLDEVEALYRVLFPTATRAARQEVLELIRDVADVGEIGADVASDVIKSLWKAEIGRLIAEAALDVADGKHDSLAPIINIIERTQDNFVPKDKVDPITTDIDALIAEDDQRPRWLFNIPCLHAAAMGVAGGEFVMALARPEAGKTAFGVSLATAPGGWCHQGALVHYIGNEEPAIRTMKRAVSACTGMTWDEIKANPGTAKRMFEPIRNKIVMLDDIDMSVEKLDLHCRTHHPDILIIDQIDKLGMSGSYGRTDEFLQDLYIEARRIAKRHNLAILGVTQASAEAEGKTRVTYAMAANSKTGKAAEADLVVGIGKAPIVEGASSSDDPTRFLTLSKNKITGCHDTVVCMLDKQISRYEA